MLDWVIFLTLTLTLSISLFALGNNIKKILQQETDDLRAQIEQDAKENLNDPQRLLR